MRSGFGWNLREGFWFRDGDLEEDLIPCWWKEPSVQCPSIFLWKHLMPIFHYPSVLHFLRRSKKPKPKQSPWTMVLGSNYCLSLPCNPLPRQAQHLDPSPEMQKEMSRSEGSVDSDIFNSNSRIGLQISDVWGWNALNFSRMILHIAKKKTRDDLAKYSPNHFETPLIQRLRNCQRGEPNHPWNAEV